jgi:hypothetical protein
MPMWVSLTLFAVLIGSIVGLFVWRGKVDQGLGNFIQDSGFEPLPALPEPVATAFGLKPHGYRGKIVVRDRTVPFLWLQASHVSSGAPHTTLHIYHGVVLSPDDADFRVETRCREAMAQKSPWRDFFALNTERPLLVKRLPDRSLLVKWNGLSRVDIYRKKMDFLSAVLA